MYSVRSVVNGNLQLFTTSDRVEAHSAEGNAGLDETRHGTPPPLKIRRRWRITFTLDDSMESRDRAEGQGAIFYELLASSKFVWMPSGHPGRRFFLARQELGSAERQEVVKEAPRTVPFELYP